MGYGLFTAEPKFREYFGQCCDILAPMIGVDLRTLLYPTNSPDEAISDNSPAFQYAYYLQSAIFSLQYALAKTLMDWGIMPDALAGHSIGEYTAACIAGILTLENCLTLIVARGRGIERAPEGAMLSVHFTETEAIAFLQKMPELTLAVMNSPNDMFFSGPVEWIAEAETQLQHQDIGCQRVHVNRAFHSPTLKAAAEDLTRVAQGMKLPHTHIPHSHCVQLDWNLDVE